MSDFTTARSLRSGYTQMVLFGATTSKRLHKLQERLGRIDKTLARLYKLSRQLTYKIDRIQRERVKVIRQIESEEVKCGKAT